MTTAAARRILPHGPRATSRAVTWSLLAACAVALVGGCEHHSRSAETEPAAAAGTADFSQLFGTHCAGCHGATGKMGPAPPLDDPIFLAIVSDEQLIHTARHGRPGTPMPAFSRAAGGPLGDAELHALIEGMRQQWKSASNLPADFPPYASGGEPPQSSAAIAAGEQLFARSCSTCHGSDGRGTSDGKPPNSLREPAFLALTSDQALRRIIITGRPDLGMPDCRDHTGRPVGFQPLSSQDVEHLVALLASWRAAGTAPAAGSTTESK